VAWVRIDRGSAWHYRWSLWGPEVWVAVTVNGKSDSTHQKAIDRDREERDLPGNLLGPFTWKWGDPEVSVSFHHKGASPPNFPSDFDGDRDFKVRNLNHLISYDRGRISLRLECPEVESPPLPPYKEVD
jgi:hypothetical protein